jgi:hypothetical protein
MRNEKREKRKEKRTVNNEKWGVGLIVAKRR